MINHFLCTVPHIYFCVVGYPCMTSDLYLTWCMATVDLELQTCELKHEFTQAFKVHVCDKDDTSTLDSNILMIILTVIILLSHKIEEIWNIKGEVSPNNNVDLVSRKQFYKPNSKSLSRLDNPFKRSDYAKLCMSPSLDGTLPEYVISQEDNSPLTLYIDFHHFQIFLDINSLFDPVHSKMHAHSSQP